jgi:hypothetical protein
MAQRITQTICASSRPVIRFYAVGAVNSGKCGLDCGLSFFGTTLTNQLEINGGHVGVNHRPRPLSVRVLPGISGMTGVWMTLGLSTKRFLHAQTPLADEVYCDLVCAAGPDPATSCVTGGRSNRLKHAPQTG